MPVLQLKDACELIRLAKQHQIVGASGRDSGQTHWWRRWSRSPESMPLGHIRRVTPRAIQDACIDTQFLDSLYCWLCSMQLTPLQLYAYEVVPCRTLPYQMNFILSSKEPW